MAKVYDTFCFFNELDILEIRLNILDPYVDYFVLVESRETFSGKEKPLYYEENKERFKKWNHKIIHSVVPSFTTENAFERAHFQKESIMNNLTHLDDDDIVYFGDVDEIWKPQEVDEKVYKLKQLNYTYYLNNRSSENWIGTIVGRYRAIKQGSLNDFRAHPVHFKEDGGWHFTNMGGVEQIRKKLESYDHQEFNHDYIKEDIEYKIENGLDYVGRKYDWQGKPFTFFIDESQLPRYITDNKSKYADLFKS